MATIKWTDRAKAVRKELYWSGVMNFGSITALKMAIEDRKSVV